jgi:K+-transporting ATPase ATPase A chain
MLLGRFGYIIPVLAIAGQLARAPRQETSEGTSPSAARSSSPC